MIDQKSEPSKDTPNMFQPARRIIQQRPLLEIHVPIIHPNLPLAVVIDANQQIYKFGYNIAENVFRAIAVVSIPQNLNMWRNIIQLIRNENQFHPDQKTEMLNFILEKGIEDWTSALTN